MERHHRRTLLSALLALTASGFASAQSDSARPATIPASANLQASPRAQVLGAHSRPINLQVSDGPRVHYEPAGAPNDLSFTAEDFVPFFDGASCADVGLSGCVYGRGAFTAGMHLPDTTAVFGTTVKLDGVEAEFNVQYGSTGANTTFYMDAPDSPLIDQNNPYPWCPARQPPDYHPWYVEVDYLFQNVFLCWLSPANITLEWGYPWGGPGLGEYRATFSDGVVGGQLIKDVQFTKDPIVISSISGDGQSIPVSTKNVQPLIVALKTAAGVPVIYPIEGNTVKPSVKIVGPSRTSPTLVSVDNLNDGTWGITVQLDNKVGDYIVTVSHNEAAATNAVPFTIHAVLTKPPASDTPDEQGNGNTNNDPDLPATDQQSQTQQAEEQQAKNARPAATGCPDSYESVGDPINVTNGNVVRMEVDYRQTGLSPLEFTRTYNSKGSVSALMGNYWTTSYDRFVMPGSGGQPFRLRRPDGQTIRFTRVGSTFVADASFHGTLMQNGTGWRYIDTNQTIEDYNSAGKLTTTTDQRGRTQTLTYSSKGPLSKVAASTGESLTFAYNTYNQISTITDQAGRQWAYSYNGYMNLTSVKNPDSTYKNFFYSDRYNPYHLTGTSVSAGQPSTDETQSEIAWEYDSLGNATATYFRDPNLGQLKRTDIIFDGDGSTRSVMDGNGNPPSVYGTQSINGRGFVKSIAGPGVAQCGNDLTRQFDAAMNVSSKVQAGHITSFTNYDAKGQFASRIAAFGTSEQRQTDYLYDSRYFNKPTQIVEPSAVAGYTKTTSLTYDSYGNLTQKTVSGYRPNSNPSLPPTAISRTWGYQYNGPYHQLSQISGPRTDLTQATKFGYNTTSGRLLSVTDANGIAMRSTIAYTPTGNVLSEVRPNGLHVAYAYHTGSDLLQSVTETQGTAIRTTTWTYDNNHRVSGITFSNGVDTDQSIGFSYNNAGQLRYVTSAAGLITYTYDPQGNPITETDSIAGQPTAQRTIRRTFDAYNRLQKVIGANNTIEYDFYPDGTLTQTLDGKQQITKRLYDGLKRLTTVIRPDQSQIQYAYDSAGNLDQITDPNQARTTYVYDDFGNKVSQISPDTGTTRYTYDLAGNLTQLADALGQVTKYTYDAGNRLLTVDRAGTAYDETYIYDNCTNGVGHLCSVTNGSGETVAYQYDAFSEITKTTEGNASVLYQYDAQGHVTHVTYPSGRTVNYAFDSGGEITSVSITENGLTSMLANNITYKPFGPVTGWVYGNGLTHSRTYDQQYWTRSISTSSASSLTYSTYDSNGNLKAMTVDGVNEGFSYDTFDELYYASGDFGVRNYAYDPVGNRTSQTADGASSTYAYSPNSNRITSQTGWTYQLDANGNTLLKLATDGSGSGYQYVYSPHNRLTAVYDVLSPAVPKASYVYNAIGQRVQKTTSGATTRCVYGLDGKLLSETDTAGNVKQEYVYFNGTPLALLGVPQPGSTASYDVSVDTTGIAGSPWTVKTDSVATGGSYYNLSMSKAPPETEAYWNFTLPYSGNYDVYVKWIGSGETTTIYTLFTTFGFNVTVNSASQTKGAWVKLGNYHFTAGANSPVRLDSQYAAVASKAYLTADAARMVLTKADAPANPNYKYVHTDHLGAPRAVSNANGTLIWRATYDPFGLATIDDDVANTGQHTTLNLRFPGQYADAESSLHYNYFRDYDTSTGKYLESDPLGLTASPNTYSYGDRNPLSRTDKHGLCVEDFCIGEALFLLAVYSEEITIGGIIGAEIVAGVPNPVSTPVSFGGRIAGEAIHDVYLGMRNGEAVYVGITKDVVCRAAQHGQRFDELVKLTEAPVLRDQARAIEQALINQNPQFENAINSIAPTRTWYPEAVEWGSAWLQERGY